MKECEEITELVGAKRLIEITANPALTGFTAGKILGGAKARARIWKQCAHILLPKDYVRYRLTGVYSTDASDASGMTLLDVPNRCWSDELLEKLNIDRSLLADVYESVDVTGTISKEAAARTGLAEGTIVVGGRGRQRRRRCGNRRCARGRSFNTIGTSGVVYAHMSKPNNRSGRARAHVLLRRSRRVDCLRRGAGRRAFPPVVPQHLLLCGNAHRAGYGG